MTAYFDDFLSGGDLRSIARVDELVGMIKNQEEFDQLFSILYQNDRLRAMRAADAVEKITSQSPEYLAKHKPGLLRLCQNEVPKELKWHIALLLARLPYKDDELGEVWEVLTQWATNKQESRIVRVNALQTLFDLIPLHPELEKDFLTTIAQVERENVPSINARIRKFKKSRHYSKTTK